MVKMLLATKEVDSKAMDDRGRTAISWARERCHLDIVKVLEAVPGQVLDEDREWDSFNKVPK